MARLSSIYNLDESKLNEYKLIAKDYCLVNGLVMFPNESSTFEKHNCVVNLPITLLPTKFSSNDFNYAINIQQDFNLLIHKLAHDHQFLSDALNNVIEVDDFTRRLWNIYEQVQKEGVSQNISLGILRSDYMLDSNKNGENFATKLSQVEINTIASSFGAATTKVAKLHKYMLGITNNEDVIKKQPNNQNLDVLSDGLLKAWSLYNNKKAKIAFVVSEKERNIGDQRLLEYEVLNKNEQVRVTRITFNDIVKKARLDNDKRLFIDNDEIAVAYYRVGYDPKDYKTEQDWNARLLVERSKAIKCPSIQYHLAGAKKIQQALCKPGSIEQFIDQNKANLIRATFVDQYSFDTHNGQEMDRLIELMNEKCDDFVLKPQREGGGNNIYGKDIREFLKTINDKSDLMGYILMKLIKPILNSNYMIKNDVQLDTPQELVNEIGIYGVIIGDSNGTIHLNNTGGYLLRSKLLNTNEGGVAAGFSALDSIYLDDD